MMKFDMDWIRTELGGLYGSEVVRELNEIIGLYALYDGPGQDWVVSEDAGYKPTKLITNIIKKLIKEESRFMAGRAPELRVVADGDQQEAVDAVEGYLAQVLERNRWQKSLISGVRDCFIGKRVALTIDGGPGRPTGIRFIPSTEFVYELDENGDVAKIIFFYGMNDFADKSRQRIYRKKLWMEGGSCLMDEGIYDGYGRQIELRHSGERTGLDFVPAYVIINDGLTGDVSGESDVRELADNQKVYNQLKSDDADALKFCMFPQKVFVDASQASMDRVVSAPGALIDLATDPSRMGSGSASATVLETQFGYDGRFEHAIDRIKGDMYDLISVPDVPTDDLKGFAASGKAMRAVYWGLISRCEEKWAEWDDALKWMVRRIVDMARLFGGAALPDIEYTVRVEHLYPIPDDEDAERARDLDEVSREARSKRSYIAKWQADADADAELSQIMLERRATDAYGMAVAGELEGGAEV